MDSNQIKNKQMKKIIIQANLIGAECSYDVILIVSRFNPITQGPFKCTKCQDFSLLTPSQGFCQTCSASRVISNRVNFKL